MPKNILIFSDGTGQAGGITFDENRTNIYKLYRATRCGPDSSIHPDEQACFYDPGLGSPADNSFMFGKLGRSIYNFVSQATGLGITANIIDCYAALIRLYRDGDRIFLFGFSRGAYTVRCLGGVIAFCGIPRRLPDGGQVPLDVPGSRKLAAYAVKHIYQFCSSGPIAKATRYQKFMLETRIALGDKFREEHCCNVVLDGEQKANVYPYCIGVFDTVAALSRKGAVILLALLSIAGLFGLGLGLSFLSVFESVPYAGFVFRYFTLPNLLCALYATAAISTAGAYVFTHFKFDFSLRQYPRWKRLATLHFTHMKQKFEDYELNRNVEYAKHAISIDENRADFARVRWDPNAARKDTRDASGNIHFEQVWFSGNHADVGGGYPENECRLSDITLRWMLAAASIIPNGIKHDPDVLRLYPDSSGMQHDEYKAGLGFFTRITGQSWSVGLRKPPRDATMHKSVYQRFKEPAVQQYDIMGPYRPPSLSAHVDFAQYYDPANPAPAPAQQPVAIADDIESKWERPANQA
ncbi:MAG TPA: DUF2235 domain-containing protein [Bryobacteraceae bacterium]|nr:DUF2235 domain-containing protein [Bryobacteraceae bacterium]